MAGYSGTPLAKKLGIKAGLRVAFFNLPADVAADLEEELGGCRMVKAASLTSQ